jgi:uncharacterized phage-associated protein
MATVWIGYSANTVANYFLELSRKDGIPIDPLKLQKLVYLAHGWSLYFLKRRLIKEHFEAWDYGPVLPRLYNVFKKFGASPITAYAPVEPPEPLDEQTKSLLNSVWQAYKSYSPIQLSMLTHEPGYAWDVAYRSARSSPWVAPTIPDEMIVDEFARRQQQAAAG